MKTVQQKFVFLFTLLPSALAIVASALLASGCISNTPRDFSSVTTTQSSLTASGTSNGGSGGTNTGAYNDPLNPPDYACPSSSVPANVIPDQGGQGYGAGNFRVCVARANAGTLKVYGYVTNQAAYCVLPLQVDAQNQPQVLTNPVDPSQAFSLCGSTQNAGTVFALPGTNFNAVIIVPAADLAQMSRCMVQTGYYDCPRYSYGRLR